MTTFNIEKNYRFGINWGSKSKEKSQDLDLRVLFFNEENKKALNDVYFGHQNVPGVSFIKDDKVGDIGFNDEYYNEGVIINFDKITTNVEKISFQVTKESSDIIKSDLSHLSFIVRDLETDEVVFAKDLLKENVCLQDVLSLSRSLGWVI